MPEMRVLDDYVIIFALLNIIVLRYYEFDLPSRFLRKALENYLELVKMPGLASHAT